MTLRNARCNDKDIRMKGLLKQQTTQYIVHYWGRDSHTATRLSCTSIITEDAPWTTKYADKQTTQIHIWMQYHIMMQHVSILCCPPDHTRPKSSVTHKVSILKLTHTHTHHFLKQSTHLQTRAVCSPPTSAKNRTTTRLQRDSSPSAHLTKALSRFTSHSRKSPGSFVPTQMTQT